MASAGKTFGVQSPSLTASGQDEPMGVSGISGHKPQAVPDAEQRKGVLRNSARKAIPLIATAQIISRARRWIPTPRRKHRQLLRRCVHFDRRRANYSCLRPLYRRRRSNRTSQSCMNSRNISVYIRDFKIESSASAL